MEKIARRPLWFKGFLQGAGVVFYCSLVAFLLANANKAFGKIPDYFGPLLFLTLFSTSALICAIITLYHPFMLFFQKKQPTEAVKLVLYTAGWMLFFTLFILLILFIT